MENHSLFQKLVDMRRSFFEENLLNRQFLQLESLERQADESFVEEVIKLYFTDATNLITIIGDELGKENPNYVKMGSTLHQLKGASASVGAKKVTDAITQLMQCLKERDIQMCKIALLMMKDDQDDFQNKLEAYFELTEQYELAMDAEEGGEESGEKSE